MIRIPSSCGARCDFKPRKALTRSIGGFDDLNPPTAAIEFYETINQCEECIVAALTHAVACLKNRAELPHDDIPGTNLLTPKSFHSATLGIGISAVTAGPLTFLMCHFNT